MDGQFLFLDPVAWRTHLLSEGAVLILREAATAIESGTYERFVAEIEQAGGWPAELEQLVTSLTTLAGEKERPGAQA